MSRPRFEIVGDDENEELPQKVTRKEPKPLPSQSDPNATAIAAIRDMIVASNASNSKKGRMTLYGIYNQAIRKLSTPESKKGQPKEAAAKEPQMSEAQLQRAIEAVMECVDRHLMMPRAETLAALLYACHREKCFGLGLNCFDFLMKQGEAKKMNTGGGSERSEAVVTCALRILFDPEQKAASGSQALQDRFFGIVTQLPAEVVKRRLLVPALQYCGTTGDLEFAESIMQLSDDVAAGIAVRQGAVVDGEPKSSIPLELWDGDFGHVFAAIEKALSLPQPVAPQAAMRCLESAMGRMVSYHPVVGRSNAEALGRIADAIKAATGLNDVTSAEAQVPSGVRDENHGICSVTGEELEKFTLTTAECDELLTDIVEKLVKPRTTALGHHLTPANNANGENGNAAEPSVPPEEVEKRRQSWKVFDETITQSSATAIIDGANVGYYGLTAWYPEVKRSQMLSRGVPANKITQRDLTIPVPVDVPLKMDHIQLAVDGARERGLSPLVILHERHMQPHHLNDTNSRLLANWRQEGVLLPSPAFLNDDYCWLYASIVRSRALLTDTATASSGSICHVISNDLMRDHHFQLLSQRRFLRWRQSHRVTYSVAWDGAAHRVNLHFPPRFSTWVQRKSVAAAVAAGGVAMSRWHVPFMREPAVLDQATNNPTATATGSNSALSKDGDDTCDAWLYLCLPTVE